MRCGKRISVVIPTFNEGKYIKRTLSTISKNKDVEIIVVDGHSTDETVEIARQFTGKIHVINKRGVSKAKNYGAIHATGDIIVFLDADVIAPPDFAEKLLEAFDGDVVGATCSIVPFKPKLIERFFFTPYNMLIRMFSYVRCNKLKFARGEFIAVRKREFIKVGGFDERLTCMEDHDLSSRLSEKGRFAFIKGLTVYESARRIRAWGFSRTVTIWFLNFTFFTLFHKTFSGRWEPVR